MANSLVGDVFTIDTVGYVSLTPIRVRKITFWPNTAGDSIVFRYAYFGSANTDYIRTSAMTGKTATVSTNAITSTGNFESAELVTGDGIRITHTNTGNNEVDVFATRTSDDVATVYGVTLTDESSKVYSWVVYKGLIAANIVSAGTEKVPMEIDFGDEGKVFPSLTCSAISSSSDLCYIYLA